MTETGVDDLGFDSTVPSNARVYNYLLGGKDNFAADREVGDRLIAAFPDIAEGARANRAFLRHAVRYLAAEAGIRQFLDVGTGIPAAGNTHEVAQDVAPDCRVVYVDNDPVVLAHARALLTSGPQGATAYIDADLRDTGAIVDQAAATLDFSKPVALMMISVVHSFPDDEAYGTVSALTRALAPGSFLAVSHLASDLESESVNRTMTEFHRTPGGDVTVSRSRDEFGRFFDGLELVEPGVVPLHKWRPDDGANASLRTIAWCAVGRKP